MSREENMMGSRGHGNEIKGEDATLEVRVWRGVAEDGTGFCPEITLPI